MSRISSAASSRGGLNNAAKSWEIGTALGATGFLARMGRNVAALREAIRAERAIMALEAEAGPLCKMQLIGTFKPIVAKG